MSTPQTKTRAQQIIADLACLLKARFILLWIVTREEPRAESHILEACKLAKYGMRMWDCVQGWTGPDGKPLRASAYDAPAQDPSQALAQIQALQERTVCVMRDLTDWLDPMVKRNLKNLALSLVNADASEARAIIVLSPSSEVPASLSDVATVLEWPLPDRAEIASLLSDALEVSPEASKASAQDREAAVDAAVGLTSNGAYNCYARSIVQAKRVDPQIVSREKRRIVSSQPGLTWYDPDPRGLDAVGGYDLAVAWFRQLASSWTPEARAYGLPAPRGALLAGIPGTGKSLLAKCVPTLWQQPLLKCDLSGFRSKYVGESEQNLRRALQLAETCGGVLWLDELDKSVGGESGGDGGVRADALGTILTWMQEPKPAPVFVLATCNQAEILPPELMSRFDAVWFLDVPSLPERAQVLAASLRFYKRDPEAFDLAKVAKVTPGFSGRELDALVPAAMRVSFADNARPLVTQDLLGVAEVTVPTTRTAGEKLDALRRWAKERARPASSPEETQATTRSRKLDL